MPAAQKKLGKQSKLPVKRDSDAPPIMTYVGVFGICAYLLVIGLGQVYLQNKIDHVRGGIAAEGKKVDDLLKVRNNLQIDRERHMQMSYIRPRALRMGLRMPQPGQVRYMPPISRTVNEPGNIAERED
jgi:hypothetical protein